MKNQAQRGPGGYMGGMGGMGAMDGMGGGGFERGGFDSGGFDRGGRYTGRQTARLRMGGRGPGQLRGVPMEMDSDMDPGGSPGRFHEVN